MTPKPDIHPHPNAAEIRPQKCLYALFPRDAGRGGISAATGHTANVTDYSVERSNRQSSRQPRISVLFRSEPATEEGHIRRRVRRLHAGVAVGADAERCVHCERSSARQDPADSVAKERRRQAMDQQISCRSSPFATSMPPIGAVRLSSRLLDFEPARFGSSIASDATSRVM